MKFILAHDTARQRAIEYLRTAPAGYVVTVAAPKRGLDQNAHLHALLTDLSRSGLEWAGRERDISEWKVLAVSGHAIATKQEAEVVVGIEGELVNLRESTAQMARTRAASLILYVRAFGDMSGVHWRERNTR